MPVLSRTLSLVGLGFTSYLKQQSSFTPTLVKKNLNFPEQHQKQKKERIDDVDDVYQTSGVLTKTVVVAFQSVEKI